MKNRVFFPQATLDQWLFDNRIELRSDVLRLTEEGRRFRIIEALRVLREVSGADDRHELIGRVKTRAFLLELGAEVLEHSMILGDNAYDVVQGFIGAPIGSFAEHLAASPRSAAMGITSDAELLAHFVSASVH
jgi:hypothetical protein